MVDTGLKKASLPKATKGQLAAPVKSQPGHFNSGTGMFPSCLSAQPISVQ